MIAAATLVASWDMSARASAHSRLATLLAATGVAGLADDTLGMRNRRLLALRQMLTSAPMEAHLVCMDCEADNEFPVPIADILAAPDPAGEAVIELRLGEGRWRFRLPCMGDLDAARRGGQPLRTALLDLCRFEGDAPFPEALVEELGKRWEALDPAADVGVEISCVGCGKTIHATVDVADFVARDIDRLTEALLRDIDAIATAYGWSEQVIAALPASRRRRYVAMIAARRLIPASGRKMV
jgi:hypothetical protein